MYKRGEWVVFEGVGEVLDVYNDAYNEAGGTPTKGVLIKVKLSDRPGHNFQVRVPIVCVGLADQRDKLEKGAA